MALIVQADIEQRLGVGETVRYSRGTGSTPNAANVSDAIAKAESRMRSEAIKVFTAASWDAMTSATIPEVAIIHLVSDAADLLSSGNKPTEEIAKKAEEARLFRIRLANDQERCFDSVLTKLAGDSGADRIRIAAPTINNMDTSNTSSRLYAVDPPLT